MANEEEVITEQGDTEAHLNEQVNNEKETKEEVVEDKANAEGSEKEEAGIPDELVSQAKDLGVSDFAISKFDNEAELKRYIEIRENEIIEAGRRAMTNTNVADDKIPAHKPDVQQDFSGEMYKIKFKDPEMIDEEVRNNLEGINKHYASVIKSLMDKVSQIDNFAPIVDQVQNDRQMREIEKFDGLIATLPTEYKEFVGDGGLADIVNNKDAKAIRDAIWDERESLKAGYLQLKLPVPSDKSLIKKAADIVLADKKEKMIKTDMKNKVANRIKAVQGRPTNRESTANLTPEEKAARNFDSKRNQFGSNETEFTL